MQGAVPVREAVQWQQLRHQRVRGLQRLVQQQERVPVLMQGLRQVQVLAPRRQLVLEPVRQRGQVLELRLVQQQERVPEGLRQVQVLAPRRQLVLEPVRQRGQVPLSALPEVRWTQPYTVFFLLSACLADYVRGSVASGQRYPQKSCHTSQFRRLGRSWDWGS